MQKRERINDKESGKKDREENEGKSKRMKGTKCMRIITGKAEMISAFLLISKSEGAMEERRERKEGRRRDSQFWDSKR